MRLSCPSIRKGLNVARRSFATIVQGYALDVSNVIGNYDLYCQKSPDYTVVGLSDSIYTPIKP